MKKIITKVMNFIPQSALILGMGTAFSALFTIVLTPMLADIYSASDFGVYVLYTSGVNIISQLICFKYEYQITASKDKKEAFELIYLSCFIAFIVMAIIMAFSLGFGRVDFVFIVIGSCLAGLNTLFVNSAIYFNQIKVAAFFSALKGALIPLMQVIIASYGGGLYWGNIISMAVIDIGLILFIFRMAVKVPAKNILLCAKRYKKYPTYMLAGSLSAALMANQQGYYINVIGSEESAGYYSMAERLLSMPVSIVSAAFSQILIRQASAEYIKKKRINVIHQASYKVWLLSGIIFGALFFGAGIIINIFLGDKWKNTVNIIRILCPLFAVRMAVVPLTALMPTIGKQRETMFWQFSMLALSFGSAFFSIYFSKSYLFYIMFNTIALSFGYLSFYCYTMFCIRTLNKEGEK